MIKIFGSSKTFALGVNLSNFHNINTIRKEAINASLVIILDDAVEEIENISSLTNFLKRVVGTEFIFLYEQPHYAVYSSLFDAAYNVPVYALDNNTLSKLVDDSVNKHELLKSLSLSLSAKDTTVNKSLAYKLPKSLPNDRRDLIGIINELGDALSSMQSSLQYLTSERDRTNTQMSALYLYTSGLIKELQTARDLSNEIARENSRLHAFKDEVQMYVQAYKEIHETYRFTTDRLFIHIKEIDDMLFSKEFLRLLVARIEGLLGMPTKCYFLTDSAVRATKIGYYQVTEVFDTSKLDSSQYASKIGYSRKFMEAIDNDKSNPSCVIIYNAMQNIDVIAPNIIHFYACRNSPNKYSMLIGKEAHTITNYPGFELSYTYNPDFEKTKNNRATRNIAMQLPLFKVITGQLEALDNERKDSKLVSMLKSEV